MEKRIIIQLENFNSTESKHFELMLDKIREMESIDEVILSYGKLKIDYLRRCVSLDGKNINFTNTEFNILFFLASYPEVVFTHRQIYEAVWKKEYFCDEGNITAHIGHIRKKLETNPRKPIYILTVRNVGYKFSKRKDE